MIPKHMDSIVEQIKEWVATQDSARKAGWTGHQTVAVDLSLAQARWVAHVLINALYTAAIAEEQNGGGAA